MANYSNWRRKLNNQKAWDQSFNIQTEARYREIVPRSGVRARVCNPIDRGEPRTWVFLEWLKKNLKECTTDVEREVVREMINAPGKYLKMMDEGELCK